MMKARVRKLCAPRLLLTLATMATLATMTAGCGKSTYLEVRFTGMSLPDIYGLAVSLILGGDGGTASDTLRTDAPDGGHRRIALPTSAAFKLDDKSGPLTVQATALDIQDQPVATASKTTTVMHEQTWSIDLDLAP